MNYNADVEYVQKDIKKNRDPLEYNTKKNKGDLHFNEPAFKSDTKKNKNMIITLFSDDECTHNKYKKCM